MIFKVAILQKRSINRAYNNNTKSVIGYMSEAKKNGADILLLPECYLTGYDLTITNNGYSQFVVGSGFPESAFKATATLDRT